jgi:ribosomal protein L40E
MEQALATAQVMTELTCWKCGEESLQEAAVADTKHGSQGELVVPVDVKHSVCQKCGAYAVNPAQARHNKITGRKTRKDRIREANRAST